MELNDIYGKLSEVLQDVLGRSDINVTEGMTARDVDGWDSLNHMRIVLSVEKEFGVRFSTTEIPELQSIDEFIDLIQTKI